MKHHPTGGPVADDTNQRDVIAGRLTASSQGRRSRLGWWIALAWIVIAVVGFVLIHR